MVVFTFSDEHVLDRMKPHFQEGEDEKAILEELRKIYFTIFITPLSDPKLSPSLDHVFHYVKARDAVELSIKTGSKSLQMEDSTFYFIKEKFEAYSGWNLQMADMILIVSEDLKKAKPQ